MSFGSAWFWMLYLVATIAGSVALARSSSLSVRALRIVATFIVLVAGLSGGMSLRGSSLDLSGQNFVLPSSPPVAATLQSIAVPRIVGNDPYVSVDVFASALDKTPVSTLSLRLRQADSLVVAGWILDAQRTPCRAVDLILDTRAYEAASLISRPDVAGVYGEQAVDSGFRAVIPLSGVPLGTHQIRIACVDRAGRVTASFTRELLETP